MEERNPVFDTMKGICIILMLIGHIPVTGMAHQFIYVFHMPAFFIIYGYFCNHINKKDKGQWLISVMKKAKRRLLPIILLCSC